MFKSLTSVQLVPFHSSVAPDASLGGTFPPKPIADVEVPDPAGLYLAVPKLLTSVQFVPFQSSVSALCVLGG